MVAISIHQSIQGGLALIHAYGTAQAILLVLIYMVILVSGM